jgi:hypothetical protein
VQQCSCNNGSEIGISVPFDAKSGKEPDQRGSASLIGRCNYYNQLEEEAFRIKEGPDALLEIAQDFIWFRYG